MPTDVGIGVAAGPTYARTRSLVLSRPFLVLPAHFTPTRG
ncbi:hypothetical protein LV79_000526 [Actinokineospora globicatena]|nr:hypothetical protein [Actinokineospora globicatena]